MGMLYDMKNVEVWFITGSQHLYGPDALKQVASNSGTIAAGMNKSKQIPCKIVFKPVVKTAEEISTICALANDAPSCVGIICWMHTFSPAKMWINGLTLLRKPFLHLHTQFNRDIPWKTIDMDFMNLNQSAHGDREFGFICSRLRKNRKVVVGHWQNPEVLQKVGIWTRAACAWNEWRSGMKVARFGDNMREVAVTEGDKVEAQKKFGFSVNGYGIGDLAKRIRDVSAKQTDEMVKMYKKLYRIINFEKSKKRIEIAARIEIGMRTFLEDGGFKAFTTTFEDLHGLDQLPGLSVQRLMADGYGFGAEGDWKTAALVRALKVMASGLTGGTSFMEDYTYHFDPAGMRVLGAHMLEVCPSLAVAKPALETHPLGIGGKDDPPRLVFGVQEGAGVNASLLDMGNRFRLLINPCRVVKPKQELPKLPVARVLWEPMPNLKTAAEAWILAGGAHHTALSMSVTKEHLLDFAEMADIEYLLIDKGTTIQDFKQDLKVNEIYYMLAHGLR